MKGVEMYLARKCIQELWQEVWKVFKEKDGSHTKTINEMMKIKQKTVELCDKINTNSFLFFAPLP